MKKIIRKIEVFLLWTIAVSLSLLLLVPFTISACAMFGVFQGVCFVAVIACFIFIAIVV